VSRMRLAAVDGMCLDLPDTPENAVEFGYPGSDSGFSRRLEAVEVTAFGRFFLISLTSPGDSHAATHPVALGLDIVARGARVIECFGRRELIGCTCACRLGAFGVGLVVIT
jgi:hypothetical protein